MVLVVPVAEELFTISLATGSATATSSMIPTTISMAPTPFFANILYSAPPSFGF